MRRKTAALAFLSIAASFAPELSARADEADSCIAAAEVSQRMRQRARLKEARESLIRCSNDACPPLVRKDCARWLGEVEAEIPTIVVRAQNASGTDVPNARVTVDSVVPALPVDGKAIAIDPGLHSLQVEADGYATTTIDAPIRAGEHDRAILVTLARPAEKTGATDESTRGAISPWTWIVGGAGVVATGSGIALWAIGRSDRSTLYATCGRTGSCTDAQIDEPKRKIAIGDVLFGVGLVGIGVGTYLGISSARSSATVSVVAQPLVAGGMIGALANF